MNKMIAAGVVAVLCHVGTASAGVPGWCKDAEDARYDLRDLSSTEVGEVISTLALATCKPTAEASGSAAQIEAARQAWGKKLSMIDADWADAVAYANVGGRTEKLELSVKDLAAMTPIDQYIVISGGGDRIEYYTDMFEPNLSEVGRFAYVDRCTSSPDTRLAAAYAQCQGDIDAFDKAKFAVQLRSDPHPRANKMALRLRAYGMTKQIATHLEFVKKTFHAKDPAAYKQLWDAAAKGRARWTSTMTDKSLLALVTKLDSATLYQSRKQFDGCEAPATAALERAIREKVPANLFKDIPLDGTMDRQQYEREFEYTKRVASSWAAAAAPRLANVPELMLASVAYIECDKTDQDVAGFLRQLFHEGPGFRGPRLAALDAMRREKIVLDDMNAKIDIGNALQMFEEKYGTMGSAGGVVHSTKEENDKLTISFAPNTQLEDDCVKSHYTKRILGYNSDNSPRYELICDKIGKVKVDHSAESMVVDKKYKPLLKKGTQFSTFGEVVIVVWPTSKSTQPSHFLGVEVK